MLTANVFTSDFLFCAEPSGQPDRASQSRSSRIQSRPKRILVVDDEKDIAESLTEILILHGYDAQAFENGKSAIESARQRCPDVVISDVIMPVINGVETVIAIQELCPRAQVLLLSGQAATSDIL
jgi:CheY-like chemotaxis protein